MNGEPKSFEEAVAYFSDPENCLSYFVERRWPAGVACPGCGGTKVSYSQHRRTWKCAKHHTRREFSAKVGTVFEDSPLGLEKWLIVTWLVANSENGVSSYQVAKIIGVTQKSAWFILHRLQLSLRAESRMAGPDSDLESDHLYGAGKDGGKARVSRSSMD